MTPHEARRYFFQNLSQVRNASDLLRLTLWVVPHLPAANDRPLGRIETMALRLQLERSASKEQIRVWWSSNRDISSQLAQLGPIYTRGSSGPSFCSGLTPHMTVPGGPNFAGPGLSLGVFAREHAAAKKKLDAATSVQAWWTTFLGQTPLWMRTAYNWHHPTPEQKEMLVEARKAMLTHAPTLVKGTNMSYDKDSGAHFDFRNAWSDDDAELLAKAPYWNALVAGQPYVHINDVKDNRIAFEGLTQAMPGVQQDIEHLCEVVCELRGRSEMGDFNIRKAISERDEALRRATRGDVLEMPAFGCDTMPS